MSKVVTRTYTLYNFEELSNAAKDKARDWYRNVEFDLDDWWETTYEDFETIANILGIDIRKRTQRWVDESTGKSGTISEPCIYFSGFSSQGDGACFEGTYSYKKGCARAIRRYALKDEALHKLADRLVAVQKRYGYTVSAQIDHSGRYYHANSTDIHVGNNLVDFDRFTVEDEDEIVNILRGLMNWLYQTLEKEHDYFLSNENIDESLALNEYTFDVNGKRED